MLLRIAGFNGASLDPPRMLPDDIGVDARNLRPNRKDFQPWRAPLTVASVPAAQLSIYRMGRDTPSDSTYWLSWPTDVDAAPGFIGTDTQERTYFTGDGVPKWTDATLALGSPPYPQTSRPLGVPAPLNAPTLSIEVAGSGSSITRYYLVTWVTDRGEESMPSAVSAQLTCNSDATIRVTRVSTVPSDGRVYSYWRIYRTQDDGAGTASFYFVAAVPVANTFYDDPSGMLGEILPSLYWAMPDAGLKGLTSLWNGIFAAFTAKRLCFCEPYRPFAWPTSYELATRDTIVGLGVYRQTLVVLTTGINYLVTGNHPSSMSMVPMDFDHACVSKRSIVSMGAQGVVWASPMGLAQYGDHGGALLTDRVFSLDQWKALVPSTMRAARIEGQMLMVCYTQSGQDKGLVFDLDDTRGVFFQDTGFADLYFDPIQDAMFVLSGTNVQKWDAGSAAAGSFTSKIYRADRPNCFAFGQLIAEAFPATVSIWAGGSLVVNGRSVTNGEAFRLPAGRKSSEWQAKVEGSSRVHSLLLADTKNELRAVP